MDQLNRSNATDSVDILERLSQQRINVSIPVLCFICLMMLVGTIGNFLVILTYVKRVEKSSTNLFIFCLAVFDIVNCTVTLPLETYDLLRPFTVQYSTLCRLHRFVNVCADLSSGFIIVCISFDRYLRIARPHQGLSVRGSRIALLVLSSLAVFMSALTLFVYGSRRVTFPGYPGIYGQTCDISDISRKTVLPLVFSTLLLVNFCVGVIILLVVYTLLGIKVKRWNKHRKNKKARCIRTSEYFVPTMISEETGSPDSPEVKPDEAFSFLSHDENREPEKGELTFKRPAYVREMSRSLDRNAFVKLDGEKHLNGIQTLPHRKKSNTLKRSSGASVSRKTSIPKLNELKRRMKVSRTTVMFISATVAFVASHIPYACIKMAKAVNPVLTSDMTSIEYAFFTFAEYSFIVSYAVNPVIYSFLNPKYRRECKTLLLDFSSAIKCQSEKLYFR